MTSMLERFQKAKRAILEHGLSEAYRELEAISKGRTPVGHMALDFLKRHPRVSRQSEAPRACDPLPNEARPVFRKQPDEIRKSRSTATPRGGITLAELEAEISRVEQVRVLLTSTSHTETRYDPYGVNRASPETMTADDLTRRIGRLYPGLDCLSPRGAISLGNLRQRHRTVW